MPYIIGNNYFVLHDFIRRQQHWYMYSEKVWVQHIDRINQCTLFAYQTIEVSDCEQRNPFICEIGPHLYVRDVYLYLTDFF